MKYLFDEHMPRWWRRELLREFPEIEAWYVGDPEAPALGVQDPEILIWCELNGFILVTNNRKSMPEHLADHLSQGRHIPGIFLFDPSVNSADLILDLGLIAGASFPGEFTDQIRFLPVG